MIRKIILSSLMIMLSLVSKAQQQMVRIADIEVYPEYLEEYIEAGKQIAATSIKEEEGVICIFPCQMKENRNTFRILEIYASPEAYQHHIRTKHFLHYKEHTMKMVKSLKLNDVEPMNESDMKNIFARLSGKAE